MSIFRVKKNANYVVMNRTALNDERLSWKAKGIVAYMLSMPDDWKFYVNEISGHAKDGEDSLRSGIKELKECGYIRRFPIKDDKTKKIIEWETHVYESPQVEKPLMENPDVEKPQVENPTLLSIEELNTDLPSIDEQNNKNIYSNEFEQFWSIYPRKVDKKKAYKSFKTALKNHSLEIILDGTQKYAKQVQNTDTKFIKHPTTFLNNDSFIDGYEEGGSMSAKDREAEQIASQYDLPF